MTTIVLRSAKDAMDATRVAQGITDYGGRVINITLNNTDLEDQTVFGNLKMERKFLIFAELPSDRNDLVTMDWHIVKALDRD